MKHITPEIAALICEILQRNIEFSPSWFESFAIHINESREYRIQGNLGFGGKFWNDNNKWYVNCYPEHMTDERRAIIDKTNAELKVLRESCE